MHCTPKTASPHTIGAHDEALCSTTALKYTCVHACVCARVLESVRSPKHTRMHAGSIKYVYNHNAIAPCTVQCMYSWPTMDGNCTTAADGKMMTERVLTRRRRRVIIYAHTHTHVINVHVRSLSARLCDLSHCLLVRQFLSLTDTDPWPQLSATSNRRCSQPVRSTPCTQMRKTHRKNAPLNFRDT